MQGRVYVTVRRPSCLSTCPIIRTSLLRVRCWVLCGHEMSIDCCTAGAQQQTWAVPRYQPTQEAEHSPVVTVLWIVQMQWMAGNDGACWLRQRIWWHGCYQHSVLYTGSPLVWKTRKCPGNLTAVWEISGKESCRGKLSIAYLRFATASVFSWMFWTRFRATFFLIESFLDILQRRWSRHSLLVALTKIYARNEWHKMVMGAAESGKMSGNSTVSGDWSPCLQYFVFTIYCWAFSTGYTVQLYYCSLWHLTDTL